jgi:dTDP-glucose 4,6-dehydratase/UDP-glucuronate decarboxylase
MPLKLTAVDNFSRGTPPWLDALKNRNDFNLIQHDIIQRIDWQGWDFVIHAASIASPIYYRMHPIETMDANVIGLRHILDRCVEHENVRSLLFFSTSEIYGNPDINNIPTDENYKGSVSCTGPRACYDESKRYGETLCANFNRVYELPVKVARPFNNYGPGLKISDRRVLPDFFRDVLGGKKIVLLSDGSATRTFCYITDAMSGYLKMLASQYNGEAFNIGCENPEISMRDLAELVVKITGSTTGIEVKKSEDNEYLTDNPQRRCPNIQKARALLGYNPTVSLEEGLTKSYEYYQLYPSDGDF